MEQKTGIRNRTIFLSTQPCIYIILPCIYIEKLEKSGKNLMRFGTQVADTVIVL